jgi:hypothetical protein
MNDTRTEQEKYEAWLCAVKLCALKGWQCVSGWVFRAPSGTRHDLSASDLAQLDRIEREGLCLA